MFANLLEEITVRQRARAAKQNYDRAYFKARGAMQKAMMEWDIP